MLKSYKVEIEGDCIKWLGAKPDIQFATGLIVIDENKPPISPVRRRNTSPLIAGKGRTIGDIVSSIVDEEDWECLK